MINRGWQTRSQCFLVFFEMLKVEFETNIRGHHVYKDKWTQLWGKKLICNRDNREEEKKYMIQMQLVFTKLTVMIKHLWT